MKCPECGCENVVETLDKQGVICRDIENHGRPSFFPHSNVHMEDNMEMEDNMSDNYDEQKGFWGQIGQRTLEGGKMALGDTLLVPPVLHAWRYAIAKTGLPYPAEFIEQNRTLSALERYGSNVLFCAGSHLWQKFDGPEIPLLNKITPLGWRALDFNAAKLFSATSSFLGTFLRRAVDNVVQVQEENAVDEESATEVMKDKGLVVDITSKEFHAQLAGMIKDALGDIMPLATKKTPARRPAKK